MEGVDPEMNEQKKGGGGCAVAAILIGVALLILVSIPLAAFWLFRAKTVSCSGPDHPDGVHGLVAPGETGDWISLDEGSLGRYSPTDFGGSLGREHFVALMADQNATELTRQTFEKNASGQVVRWRLKTSEVRGGGGSGPLQADFQLPYRIQTGTNSWTGSSIMIRAEFPAAELEKLATLRREDWTTVEGRLELKGRDASLLEARLVGEPDKR